MTYKQQSGVVEDGPPLEIILPSHCAEQLRSTAMQIPMRRVGAPDERTGAFLYLCSDKLCGYVTGQVIEVNGGLLMP